jgi:hypothetical protein
VTWLGITSADWNKYAKNYSTDGYGSLIHATSDILREEMIQIDMMDNLHITDIRFI